MAHDKSQLKSVGETLIDMCYILNIRYRCIGLHWDYGDKRVLHSTALRT